MNPPHSMDLVLNVVSNCMYMQWRVVCFMRSSFSMPDHEQTTFWLPPAPLQAPHTAVWFACNITRPGQHNPLHSFSIHSRLQAEDTGVENNDWCMLCCAQKVSPYSFGS